MPSTRTLIQHVHIADGFTDDCEELIHRWLKTNTLTYETFCEIWKDMQFNFLYHGRTSGAEMAELSEELLQIAKHYMVSNTDNFEESVAGLFLVYALLRLQPYPRFAALRIVPEDTTALSRIETVARRERRYDVLYILGSILIEGPVHYHAANRERGMEPAIRKYLEGTTGIDRIGVRPKGVFYRQNEESDLLRELNSITKRYVEAKKAIGGESSQSLNYTDENLAPELDRSLKEIINGIIEEGPEANKKMQDHYSRVQQIKEKAMMQAVHGVKHLASVDNRPSGSGTRSSKRLREKKKRRQRASKRRRSDTISTSDSSSDDIILSSGSEDHDNKDKDSSQDTDKETIEEEKEVDLQIDCLPVFIRTEQDGQLYEIEIIDNFDKTPDKDQSNPSDVLSENIDALNETNDNPIDPGEGTSANDAPIAEKETTDDEGIDPEEGTSTVVTNEEAVDEAIQENPALATEKSGNEVSEGTPAEPKDELQRCRRVRRRKKVRDVNQPKAKDIIVKPVLKKLEKRELKKTALKSKFKRMGMLRMANFQDKNGDKVDKKVQNSDTSSLVKNNEKVQSLDLFKI